MNSKLPILLGSGGSPWVPVCVPEVRRTWEYMETRWDFYNIYEWQYDLVRQPSGMNTETGIFPYRTATPPSGPPLGLVDRDPELCLPAGGTLIRLNMAPPSTHVRMPLADGIPAGHAMITNLHSMGFPIIDRGKIRYKLTWGFEGKHPPEMTVMKYNFNPEGTRYIAVRIIPIDSDEFCEVALESKPTDASGVTHRFNGVRLPTDMRGYAWTLFIDPWGVWGLRVQDLIEPDINSFMGEQLPTDLKVCQGAAINLFEPIQKVPNDPGKQITELRINDIYCDREEY